MVLVMADVAVIATIVGFFLAAALLLRGLDRVIADSGARAVEPGDEHGIPEREPQPGRSA
jgi:hypothetical protein